MAVSDYDPIIEEAAKEWDVDPNWVRSVMHQESEGNPAARGTSGEVGLMQTMPKTGAMLGGPTFDPRDPVQSIWAGTKYLAQMRDKFNGNVPLATAAYNAGPERVDQYVNNGTPLPASTVQKYIPGVSGHYKQYAGQPAAPSTQQTTKNDVPSDEEFLKQVTAPTATDIQSDNDFLKSVGAKPGQPPAAGPPDQELPVPPIPPEQAPPVMGNPATAANALGGDQFIPNAAPANPSQDTYRTLRNALEPDPAYNYAKFAPVAMDAQGKPHLAMPLAAHELAQGAVDLLYGPQMGTVTPEARNTLATVVPGGLMKSPAYIPGRFSMIPPTGNPENAMTAATATGVNTPASRAGFAARNALPAEPPLAAAPQPVTPLAATGGLVAPSPIAPVMHDVDPVTGVATPVGTSSRNPLGAAPTTAEVPLTTPPPPTPKAAQPAGPQSEGDIPNLLRKLGIKDSPEIPRTSDAAEAIAGQYYKQADQLGGQLTPTYTNKVVDKMQAIPDQTREALATGTPDQSTLMAERLNALRDQPITFEGAQGIDKNFNKVIGTELRAGNKESAADLIKMRDTFRDAMTSASPEDVIGGPEGFQALIPARKAWSQAMKMRDLEAIQERANMTDNPATSIKSGIRVLLSNPNRSRGYTDVEKAALKDAGERGIIGGALHVFGSRLFPGIATALAGGAGYAGGGPLPAAAAGVVTAGLTHAGAAAMRRGATALQTARMNNALAALGKSVPPPLTPGALPW